MKAIKFRGRVPAKDSFDGGRTVYGSLVDYGEDESGCSISYRYWIYPVVGDRNFPVDPETVAQLIGRDGKGNEVYEGDALTVDIDGLKAANGVGLMADELTISRPKGDAALKFFYDEGRWQLYWTTHNGKVDTGLDWRVIKPYIEFFTVIKEAEA